MIMENDWASIRRMYEAYKIGTNQVKEWLRVPADGTCRQIMEAAHAMSESGCAGNDDISHLISTTIEQRKTVSQAIRSRMPRSGTNWCDGHDYFIRVLEIVHKLVFPTPLDVSQLALSEDSQSRKDGDDQLSTNQLDSKVDDTEAFLDVINECHLTSQSISQLWKLVYHGQVDYISASFATNCAYSNLASSISAAHITRDIWDDESSDNLINLAKEVAVANGSTLYDLLLIEDLDLDKIEWHIRIVILILRDTLDQHRAHDFKFPVPFVKDLLAHLETKSHCFKLSIAFGLELFYGIVDALTPRELGETILETSLKDCRSLLAEEYGRALVHLCNIALADERTRKSCEVLLDSLGIQLEGFAHIDPAIFIPTNFDWSKTQVSKKLDVWSLGHHLGYLQVFSTKLSLFNQLSPHATPGIFTFLYILNIALLKAGQGLDYDVRVAYVLDAQTPHVFRTRRPTTSDGLVDCLKNTITPGTDPNDHVAIQKIHLKRSKAISEDVSVSLPYCLFSNNFKITSDTYAYIVNSGNETKVSIYHDIAFELMRQMNSTYNGVSIHHACQKALVHVDKYVEITQHTLNQLRRNLSKNNAKKLARALQDKFSDIYNEPGPTFLPRLPIPRSWFTTDRHACLHALFHVSQMQLNDHTQQQRKFIDRFIKNITDDEWGSIIRSNLVDPKDLQANRFSTFVSLVADKFGINHYVNCIDLKGRNANGVNPRVRAQFSSLPDSCLGVILIM